MSRRFFSKPRLAALSLCWTLLGAQAAPLAGWGYVGWWMPKSWANIKKGQFDRLLFFELKVSANGEVTDRHGWPAEWVGLRERAAAVEAPLDLTLTLFSAEEFNALFTSVAATRTLLGTCADLVAPFPGIGLQIDFEIFGAAEPQALENYRTFVRELSSMLRSHQPSRHFSVFLPASGAAPLYDSGTLNLFDHVVIQGYDTHWVGSKSAGPVAPLRGSDAWTWEKALAYAASLGVKHEKALLSFPLFGYEWSVANRKPRSSTLAKGAPTSFAPLQGVATSEIATSVLERVREFGAVYDPPSGSSHYHFQRPDGQHVQGWFEDWWTLDQKIDFAIDQSLGGIAFFLVGYDDYYLVNHFNHRKQHVATAPVRVMREDRQDP